MRRLKTGLGIGTLNRPGVAVPPPSAIVLSNVEIPEDAAVETLIGNLLTVGGEAPYVYVLTSDPLGLLAIDGSALEVGASLTGETTYDFSVKVTDAKAAEHTQEFTLEVEDVTNDSGVDTGDGDVVDDGGFEQPPYEADTNAGLKVTGKNGGYATMLFDVGAPVAGEIYTMQYDPDWSQMSRQGRDAAVGFAFKNGNDFHLVSLRGDGNNPTSMRNSRVYGAFNDAKNFSKTDDGATSNGTKDGPNWLQLEIAAEGDEYIFRTSADGMAWDDEYVDTIPAPLSNATDAVQFGPGAYFTRRDNGVFSIAITSWNVSGAGDEYFNNVVLLVGFDGADGATSAADDSNSAHTLTFNAHAQLDTAQFKFGSASALFDGTGDYISAPDHADFHLSNANSDKFTIEAWVRIANLSASRTIVAQRHGVGGSQFLFYVSSGGELALNYYYGSSSNATLFTSGASITTGQWYHVAVDKDATGKIRLYVLGVMLGSDTPANSAFFNPSLNLNIGAWLNGANNVMNGWIDELRITKGVARYASDAGFTVPNEAFPRS